jgi:hypothetical protein
VINNLLAMRLKLFLFILQTFSLSTFSLALVLLFFINLNLFTSYSFSADTAQQYQIELLFSIVFYGFLSPIFSIFPAFFGF